MCQNEDDTPVELRAKATWMEVQVFAIDPQINYACMLVIVIFAFYNRTRNVPLLLSAPPLFAALFPSTFHLLDTITIDLEFRFELPKCLWIVWEPFLDGFLNAYPKCHERSALGRVIMYFQIFLGLCVKEISAENRSESEANDLNLGTVKNYPHKLSFFNKFNFHV